MKGMTIIDSLMLILVIGVIVVSLGVFLGEETLRAQSLRYESQQHHTALLTVFNKHVVLKVNQTDVIKGRLGDIVMFNLCTGDPSNATYNYSGKMKDELNFMLGKINSPQKHYIFDVKAVNNSNSSDVTGFRVYDNKSSVCLEDIPVSKLYFNSSCNRSVEIVYGTWFTWEDPPTIC